MSRLKAETKVLLDFIAQKLDSYKAEDISRLDVRSLSSITDFMIIATGTSSRHVLSLAHHLADDLRKQGYLLFNDPLSGEGSWTVLDLGSVLVHLFTSEARLRYDLESLWSSKSGHSRKAPQKSA